MRPVTPPSAPVFLPPLIQPCLCREHLQVQSSSIWRRRPRTGQEEQPPLISNGRRGYREGAQVKLRLPKKRQASASAFSPLHNHQSTPGHQAVASLAGPLPLTLFQKKRSPPVSTRALRTRRYMLLVSSPSAFSSPSRRSPSPFTFPPVPSSFSPPAFARSRCMCPTRDRMCASSPWPNFS